MLIPLSIAVPGDSTFKIESADLILDFFNLDQSTWNTEAGCWIDQGIKVGLPTIVKKITAEEHTDMLAAIRSEFVYDDDVLPS